MTTRRCGWILLFGVCSLLCSVPVLAQDIDGLTDGEYIENTVVGRDLALRLRIETVFSEADNDLLDQDIQYARFPTAINSAEAKLFQNGGNSINANYALWQNSQGLDNTRWSWKIRTPLKSTDFQDVTEQPPYFSFSYRFLAGDTNTAQRQYLSLGYDQYPLKDVYMALQYRAGMDDGSFSGHQLSEYVSWSISERFRIGETGAVSKNNDIDGVTPWYGQVFGTAMLVKDWTSVRIDARHYQANDSLSYQDYDIYLYQRIGEDFMLRLNYRYYMDSEDLTSSAVGIKLKYYFSPSFSVHVGYRYYDHNEQVNLNTYYVGLGLLL